MKYVDEYISPEDFQRLISFAKSERDRVLFTLIYNTGRRVSEVVGSLKAKDISQKTPNIYFTILKKRRHFQTWIRVSEETIAMIREYTKSMDPEAVVFPITRSRADDLIKEMGGKAGMLNFGSRKIHVHMLRHSFAVNRARKCRNVMDLMRLKDDLQHNDINMTAYYINHFREEDSSDI